MKYLLAFVFTLACAAAGVLALRYQSARLAPAPPAAPRIAPAASQPQAAPELPPPTTTTPHSSPVPTPAATPAPTASVPAAAPLPPALAPTSAPAPGRAGPLTDAVAPAAPSGPIPREISRLALAYVGADPDAEDIWVQAINDPAVSAHDRSDLIEDLNEEGFMDPENVTYAELPLVLNRLAMIQDLAPYAMDQVNADAFAEAYKDLANIYLRLAGNQ